MTVDILSLSLEEMTARRRFDQLDDPAIFDALALHIGELLLARSVAENPTLQPGPVQETMYPPRVNTMHIADRFKPLTSIENTAAIMTNPSPPPDIHHVAEHYMGFLASVLSHGAIYTTEAKVYLSFRKPNYVEAHRYVSPGLSVKMPAEFETFVHKKLHRTSNRRSRVHGVKLPAQNVS